MRFKYLSNIFAFLFMLILGSMTSLNAYTDTCMHAITISEKRAQEFEGE